MRHITLSSQSLSGGQAAAAHVGAFRATLLDEDGVTLADGGCRQASTYGGRLGPFPVAERLTLIVDYFAGADCHPERRVGRAFRGGLDLTAVAGFDRPLTIHLTPVWMERFSGQLPMPAPALRRQLASMGCNSDDVCRLNGEHPAAYCEVLAMEDESRCRLDTLYPLNSRLTRGFLAGLSFETSVVFAGGSFGATPSSSDSGPAPGTVEEFNPTVGLFRALPTGLVGAHQPAWHRLAATVVGDSTFAMAPGGESSEVGVHFVDVASGQVRTTRLPLKKEEASDGGALVGARALRLTGPDASAVFVGGEFRFDPSSGRSRIPNEDLVVCGHPAADLDPTCAIRPFSETDNDALGTRCGHALVCMDGGGSGGGCRSFLVAGGRTATSGGEFSVVTLPADVNDPAQSFGLAPEGGYPAETTTSGWEWVPMPSADRSKLLFAVIGGHRRLPPSTCVPEIWTANVPVSLASVDLDAARIEFRPARASGPTAARMGRRLFHTATAFRDGRVLVAGGLLGAQRLPTRSALVLELGGVGEDSGESPYLAAWPLAEDDSLSVARYGHSAVRIPVGPLAGSIVLVGGFSSASGVGRDGEPVGAEVFGVQPLEPPN